MRILVIDDLRVFAASDHDEVVYARDGDQARALLRAGRWDQVWFDHDLGVHPVTGHVHTSMPIAQDMEAAWHGVGDPVDVGEVFVHTDNVVARPRLLAALRCYGARYVPAASVTVEVLDPPA